MPPAGAFELFKPSQRPHTVLCRAADLAIGSGLSKFALQPRRRIVAMLTTARERLSATSVRSRKTPASGPAEAGYETLPASARWIQRRLLNPLRNRLLPAGLIRRLLAQSASPLVAESLVRPGGWRSMEI